MDEQTLRALIDKIRCARAGFTNGTIRVQVETLSAWADELETLLIPNEATENYNQAHKHWTIDED